MALFSSRQRQALALALVSLVLGGFLAACEDDEQDLTLQGSFLEDISRVEFEETPGNALIVTEQVRDGSFVTVDINAHMIDAAAITGANLTLRYQEDVFRYTGEWEPGDVFVSDATYLVGDPTVGDFNLTTYKQRDITIAISAPEPVNDPTLSNERLRVADGVLISLRFEAERSGRSEFRFLTNGAPSAPMLPDNNVTFLLDDNNNIVTGIAGYTGIFQAFFN